MRILVVFATALALATTARSANSDLGRDQHRLSEALGQPANASANGWSRLSGFARAGEHATAEPATGATDADFAVAVFTVPTGASGFYSLTDSYLRRDTKEPGQVGLHVSVRHAGVAAERQPTPAVRTALTGGEVFDFDAFLGYLAEGDAVEVRLSPQGDTKGDRTEIDFRVSRVPFIPVSVFPEDLARHDRGSTGGSWSLADGISANAPAARWLAWGRENARSFTLTPTAAKVTLPPAADRESIASFRVPHSGYYATHDASVAATAGSVEARWYVGQEPTPRRTWTAAAGTRLSVNADLGYVRQGDVIYLALANRGTAPATAELTGTIIEWAPRRAPLRAHRGADGTLAVFEPEAPRQAITIPPSRWLTVPATNGDDTEALRQAFARAKATQTGSDYVGIRLEAGKIYTIATQQVGGTVFSLRGARRIVLDGNGATLKVASPELPRQEVELFAVTDCMNVVISDLIVEAPSVPFTIGEIIDVTPREATTQTVTFRVGPGLSDPIADIRRNGEADGYAYDPNTPGRLDDGTWTHYPGDGKASLKATSTPGVFTHRVRRTGASIRPGAKWLVKNKRAGVVYLETGGQTENITLSRVVGRAAGGTHLRFWQTSGINLLDCRFEPEGENWIGSSSDSVHGRGREGVWIEDTVIRGVCEDIMNTYGENMVVVADGNPSDTLYSIRMYQRSVDAQKIAALRQPKSENLAVGDQLVFFNPNNGRVLGYATVQAIEGSAYRLSNAIDDVDTWEEGDDKRATMVYNTRAAGRFFVRDSRLMDSLRFGVYIKARSGVIFGTRFEGLSAAGVFAANEPEWPEGPPATHLWVQDCFFSRNNDGYMSKHRAFMTVDPADISVYTRRLNAPGPMDDEYKKTGAFRAHVTAHQYANSHVKLLGNTFHDWRGMGIAVRNARNVRIEDNLFLTPVDDAILRRTLAIDPALASGGVGHYAGIYLDSVSGVALSGNRFHGLPNGDRTIVRDQDVSGLTERDNSSAPIAAPAGVEYHVPFNEWFGAKSAAQAGPANAAVAVALNGPAHRIGRIGAGVFFDGQKDIAILPRVSASGDRTAGLTIAAWILPDESSRSEQVIFTQGSDESGVVIAIVNGRVSAGIWQGRESAWLDLGPAHTGGWQHVAVTFDGAGRSLRGYADGMEVASASGTVPTAIAFGSADGLLGGAREATRISADRKLNAETGFYRGGVDEFHYAQRVLTPAEIALLALRRAPAQP